MGRNIVLAAISIVAGMGIITGCVSEGRNQKPEIEIKDAAKPSIDSSWVLSTLDLYRAKRYNGLREALSDSVERVHKLVLYGQDLGTIPKELGALAYLGTLDVAYNRLTELPDELSGLHYLQGFYANGNMLTQFPVQILLLPVLTRLDLSENQITEIPEEIVRMDQLVRLTLDQNLITRIPVQVYELEDLEILELKNNGLNAIPEGISNLKSLKKLDLAQNQLTTLPNEITSMTGHLKEMNIQGNRISREEIDWLVKAMPSTKIRF